MFKGGSEAFKWGLEENRKQLVKDKLKETISNMIKLVESNYDAETYQKVKDSIDNFKDDILDYVDCETISVTLKPIVIKFRKSIQAINNLSQDESLKIIKYAEELTNYIKAQTQKQTLQEKNNLNNIVDNDIDYEVNACQQESKCYIESIREKKYLFQKVIMNFFLN